MASPTAFLLSTADVDDMVEELDPTFQKSLEDTRKEYKTDKAIALRDYVRRYLKRRTG